MPNLMLNESTRQNIKIRKVDPIWPFDPEFDLLGQMPFWQPGDSESRIIAILSGMVAGFEQNMPSNVFKHISLGWPAD